MSIQGMPTKSAEEALYHMREIAMMQAAQQRAMKKEGDKKRAAREKNERLERLWLTDLLPNFEARRGSAALFTAFVDGVPASVRPVVWKTVIGNERGITQDQYKACIDAFEKETPNTSFVDDVQGGAAPPSVSSAVALCADIPKPESRKRIFRRRRSTPKHASVPQVPPLNRAALATAGRQIDADLGRMHFVESVVPSDAQLNQGAHHADLASESVAEVDDDDDDAEYEIEEEDTVMSHQSPSLATAATPTSTASTPPPNAADHGLAAVVAQSVARPFVDAVGVLLKAFVQLQPDVGYVQGMSYLAGMLLYELSPFEAFVAMTNMLMKGHFPAFYTMNTGAMASYLNVYSSALEEADPILANKLRVVGAVPELYVVEWWMTLFSRSLPIEVARRCWDLYFADPGMLIRVSVAIVLTLRDELLSNPADGLVVLTTLRRRRSALDWNGMLDLAVSSKSITPLRSLRRMTEAQLQPWRRK